MVGIYYSPRPIPIPAGLCHICHGPHVEGLKVRRTGHICGIPLLPLRSDYLTVCRGCGTASRLHTGRNRYYPGRQNPGSWLTHGQWGKGRSGKFDCRESYTFRFMPRLPFGYRYRRW